MTKQLSIISQVYMHHNQSIPLLGLGTYKAIDTIETAIKTAWDAGYRHIDTATFYQNEKQIGDAIRKLGIPREELFVTSKLWHSNHGYENAIKAFNTTLSKLGFDYLDLYLIHWPDANAGANNPQVRRETWRALEDLHKQGKIKSIGVSNYTIHHLEEMIDGKYKVDTIPHVNQFELHPKLTQKPLVEYCKKHNIVVESYSPFGKGALFKNLALDNLAKKNGVTISQLIVRWVLQQGIICIPKSDKPERIRQNADVYNFEISDEDMQSISNLDEDWHCTWDPTNVE
jgi:diketogulonate reductase-like aldo/keto reductase